MAGVRRSRQMWFGGRGGSEEALRLLANSYKHDIRRVPDKEILHHLRMDETRNYDWMAESNCFRKGLAKYLALPEDKADYAGRFLADVEKQPMVSQVKPRIVSLFDFAC